VNEDKPPLPPKHKESLAATSVNKDGIAYGWVPIVKVEADGDTRKVFGLVTNDDIDSDQQIVDSAFAKRAMADWFKIANVRQMHSTQLAPAGKGIRLEDTPKGQWVEALVVEPTAVKLVDAGVYAGYSVGISRPRIVRDSKAPGGRIVDGNIVEISLVDRPANYSAKFAVVKRANDGSMEFVGKAVLLDGEPELEYEAPRRPALKRVHKGTHVTVHARNEYGNLEAYEGQVVNRTRTDIALDRSGYGHSWGVIVIPEDDIEGIYKGAFPLESLAKVASGPALTEEMLTKLTLRIKQDSSGDLLSAMRRLSQWALSGISPMSDADLERVYNQYAAEFTSRNPAKKIEDFPATSIGKGRIGKVKSLDELVAKFNSNHDENGRFAAGDGGTSNSAASGMSANRQDIYGAHSTPRASKPSQTERPPKGSALSAIRAWDHAQSRAFADRAANAKPMDHPGGEKPGEFRNIDSMSHPDTAFKPGPGMGASTTAGTDKWLPQGSEMDQRDRNTTAEDPEGFGDPLKEDAVQGGSGSQRVSADERTTPIFGASTQNQKADEPEVTKTTEEDDSVTTKTTEKAADTCDKCKGAGMFEGIKCDKCGGTKVVKQAAQAHAAAAEAHAAAADAADDPQDAADHANDAEDQADEADDAEDAADNSDDEDTEKKAAKVARKAAKKAKAFVPAAASAPVGPPPAAQAAPADAQPAGTAAADAAPVKVKKTAEEKAAKKAAKIAKKAAKAHDAIPFAIRKAHDWTCAAYKSDDLTEAYPTIEKSAALGPNTRSALVEALQKSLADPATNAQEIVNVSKAIGALEDVLDSADDELMKAAREEMNAAFKADNPSVGDYPKPSESITPGQFKRPYVSSGHQTETASAHAPRIPTTTHPTSADDYTRGPLTDGHARTLASKMVAFHDALSSWKPDLCLMNSDGQFAFDRQPSAAFDRTRFTKEVPNQEKATPTEVSTAAMAAATKAVDLTGQQATPKVYTSDELEAALSKAVTPLLVKVTQIEKQNKTLREEYEALAASPDPNRSAHRGVAGVPVTKLSSADVTKAERKAQRVAKKAEKIALARDLALSPDAAMRIHAQKRLARYGLDA
jgi:hypothetical protein